MVTERTIRPLIDGGVAVRFVGHGRAVVLALTSYTTPNESPNG